MNKQQEITAIDLREIPEVAREATAKAVVKRVSAGERQVDLAKEFGTTTITVNRWVKLARKGELVFHSRGRPSSTGTPKNHKEPAQIDYTLCPPTLAKVVRQTAAKLAFRLSDKKREQIATRFGTTVAVLNHWIEQEAKVAAPKKRGRPKKVVAETTTVTPKRGRGRPKKVVA